MYEPINTPKLYEQIVERIETMILAGHLTPGDKLPPERELSERFKVSRTVIRESVRTLQEKGLLVIRPGVGTFVHDGTSDTVRQSIGRLLQLDKKHGLHNLTQVREIFEPEIAALAALHATDNDCERMELAINTMDDATMHVDRFVEADHEFHLALATATQNALIVDLLGSIVEFLEQQRRHLFWISGDGAQRSQVHHKRIYKAVIAHDAPKARAAMMAHLQQVREDLEKNGGE